MARYWLAPVSWDGCIAEIGAERMELTPEPSRQFLLKTLQAVHPRLLMTFKAQALLGDDAEPEACGTAADKEPLSEALEADEPIVLASGDPDGARNGQYAWPWPLSHCAEAYLNRLPAPHQELGAWLEEASHRIQEQREETAGEMEGADAHGQSPVQYWLKCMKQWQKEGKYILFLKED